MKDTSKANWPGKMIYANNIDDESGEPFYIVHELETMHQVVMLYGGTYETVARAKTICFLPRILKLLRAAESLSVDEHWLPNVRAILREIGEVE